MNNDFLKVGDGTGDAALAHVQTTRSVAATTIDVDTIAGFPPKFVGTYGTLDADGFITPASKRDFYGHIAGPDIIIDGHLPGSTDTGNTAGQVVLIKPNTHWANAVADTIRNITGYGTPGIGTFAAITGTTLVASGDITTATKLNLSGATPTIEATNAASNVTVNVKSKGTGVVQADGVRIHGGADYVQSGLVITADAPGSTRAISITAGVVVINGKPVAVGSLTASVLTASRDAYFDVTSAGVLAPTYVTNNAASPALAAGSIRIGIVVVGASNVASAASINQGQTDKVLPIASSIPYTTTDSLGNLIYNTSPYPDTLGYAQITSAFQTTSFGSDVTVTGLTVVVNVPTNVRRLRIAGFAERIIATGGVQSLYLSIFEGATLLNRGLQTQAGASYNNFVKAEAVFSVTPGVHTYTIKISQELGGTVTLGAGATSPAFIHVKPA